MATVETQVKKAGSAILGLVITGAIIFGIAFIAGRGWEKSQQKNNNA